MAENEDEVVSKPKGSNLVLIMVIALLLVILIMGSTVIYLIMTNSGEAEPTAPEASKQSKPEKKKDTASSEIGVIYPLEPFTVNLASEGGSKYLKATIQLEQNIPELTPELDKKKPVIIDAILSILSSKSYEEISTNKGKAQLKEEILQRVNELLNDGFIKHIYITDFVVS